MRPMFVITSVLILAIAMQTTSTTTRQGERWRRRRNRIRRLLLNADRPVLQLYHTFGDNQDIETTASATTTSPTTTTPTTTPTTTATRTPTATAETRPSSHNTVLERPHSDAPHMDVLDEHGALVREGALRLVGGSVNEEGNVEIYHDGEWGSVCDDEWDVYEARIVCRHLGYPDVVGPTYASQFGYARSKIWMDNLYCYGKERALSECRFDGWGIHDCDSTEAAGVRCEPRPPPTTPRPLSTTSPAPLALGHAHVDLEVRLADVAMTGEEGVLEVRLDGHGDWGRVCGEGWGLREALVVCRQLGLGYALMALQDAAKLYETASDSAASVLVSGLRCVGHESRLFECGHDGAYRCDQGNVAGVVCTRHLADLEPDLHELVTSVYLDDKQLFFLQCAMEENCLASEAYRIRREEYNYATSIRRLLRFTTSIANVGDADFRPFAAKESWQWHGCHQHFHSMEVFAHFDLLDHRGRRVSEGHKASFCLEDNHCQHHAEAKYNCDNYGDQGITPGCKDIYYHNIDCQWLDVTELPLGVYTFRMAINPEYKVAEMDFENNAAICTLHYTEQFAVIDNCSLTRP